MSHLWKWCKNENWCDERRICIFLAINTTFFGILGITVWRIVSMFVLKEIVWMLCFAGYAGFVPGVLGGIFFLWKNFGEEEKDRDE